MPYRCLKVIYTALPLLLLTAMVFAPLIAVTSYDDAIPAWTTVWQDGYYQQRIIWTIFQAALTVLLTAAIGMPIAWVFAHWQFVGRQTVLRLLMLPFVMPTLVAGIGVLALFGERGALWQGWTDTPYLLIYGNVFFNLPVMILALYQGFIRVPANRLAAVRLAGAGVWRQFRYAEWTVVRPWLAGAACLVFLYCFSGFGLALLLGGQQYATIEVEIYRLVAYELDTATAAALVWPVLACTFAAAAAYTFISRHSHTAPIRSRLPEPIRRPLQYGAVAAVYALLLFCCALPLLAVLLQALNSGSAWAVLRDQETLSALWNTARFSFCAVAAALILGGCHAAAARRFPVMRLLTFLPFMVSTVCLSFGVLLLYPHWASSLAMLLAMYTLLAYPFVTKDILSAWDALPAHYLHAARLCGASPFQTAIRVSLPLLLPAARRGLTLAAATCIGEFAASLFLSRPEWTTLTTLIYRYLGKPGTENYHKALVLTLLLMLAAGIAFTLLDKGKQDKAA